MTLADGEGLNTNKQTYWGEEGTQKTDTHLTATIPLKYSKTCVKGPLSKRPNIGFQNQLLLYAGQKSYRMLQWEHSAILSTFIKLPVVFKTFVLSF